MKSPREELELGRQEPPPLAVRMEGFASRGGAFGFLNRSPGAVRALCALREDLRLARLLLRCLVPAPKARLPYIPLYAVGATLFSLALAYLVAASREPVEPGAHHPFETAPTGPGDAPKAAPGLSGLDMLVSAPMAPADRLPPPEPAAPAAEPRPQAADWSKTVALAREPVPAAPAAPERPAFRVVAAPQQSASKATSAAELKPGAGKPGAGAARAAGVAAGKRPLHRERQYRDLMGRFYDR